MNAASVVQRTWRSWQARRTLAALRRNLEERRSAAASTLQRAWRSRVARKHLAALHAERCQSAAITIQSWFRTLREIETRQKQLQAQVSIDKIKLIFHIIVVTIISIL